MMVSLIIVNCTFPLIRHRQDFPPPCTGCKGPITIATIAGPNRVTVPERNTVNANENESHTFLLIKNYYFSFVCVQIIEQLKQSLMFQNVHQITVMQDLKHFCHNIYYDIQNPRRYLGSYHDAHIMLIYCPAPILLSLSPSCHMSHKQKGSSPDHSPSS